jgi:hypothetical protein
VSEAPSLAADVPPEDRRVIPFPARVLPAALAYAARGWPVLPLEPIGKEPLGKLVRRGHRDATTDSGKIRAWWSAVPDANVGAVCGPQSFDVLDVDGSDGEASLAALEKEYGKLPETRMHSTGRGRHILFLPSGLPCSAGRLGTGLDTKGRGGGYVVMPPSVHSSGKVYAALDLPLVAAPPWLLALAQARGPKATSRTLAESVARVRCAPEGERDDTLYNEARIVSKDAGLPEEAATARNVLLEAAPVGDGFTRADAQRASTNGLRDGLAASARIRSYYRRIPLDLPLDPRFARRSAHAQLIAFHICAGVHSTFIPGLAIAPVQSLAAVAHLTEKQARLALRELALARLLLSDLRAGVFWIPSVTEASPPENLDVHRGREKALTFHVPKCTLREKITALVAKQRCTENPRAPKRALKSAGTKGKGALSSPLSLPNGDPHERENERAAEVA